LNPAAAIAAGTNPAVVDSGLPNQNQAGRNVDTSQSAAFSTETFNGSGVATSITSSLVAYVKGRKIYSVNLLGSSSQTPVQVSSLSDVCGFYQAGSLSDLSNASNSWLEVGEPGADGLCFTSDDTTTLVHLSSSSSSAPVTGIAGIKSVAVELSSTGAITGFLDTELQANGTITLNQRNTSFGSPVSLGSFTNTALQISSPGLASTYVAGTISGQSSAQLFQVLSGSLSPSLYTFTNNLSTTFQLAAGGGNDYFSDGGSILKLSGSTVTTLLTVATGQTVGTYLIPTESASQLIFSSTDVAGNGGIYSASTGTGSVATLLVPIGVVTTNTNTSYVAADPASVDPSGLVYINQSTFVETGTTTTPSSSAIVVKAGSPTVLATYPSASWAGENSVANGNGTQVVILDTNSGSSNQQSLDAYASSTDTLLNHLGTVSNATATLSFGNGNYLAVTAFGAYPNNVSVTDAYLVNTSSAGSLQAISVDNPTTGSDAGNNFYLSY
jgi:hypothetical protein